MRTIQFNVFRKYLWKQPLVIFLLLLTTSAVFASEQKAVLGFKQATLESVLKEITETYKVEFTYDPSIIKSATRIDLEKKERTLKDLLAEIANQTGLKFMKVGNLIGIQKATVSFEFETIYSVVLWWYIKYQKHS